MIRGKVVDGKKIGRELGFPTANVLLDSDTPVAEGVYAAMVDIDGRRMRGMAYVGEDGNGKKVLEVNIFDFGGNIYGQQIGIELLKMMRPVEKFGSTEELRAQLTRDRQNVTDYFKNKS